MHDTPRDCDAQGLDRELAGESVRFLAAHALWWPRLRTVFVADVHLGKTESFRALGVPVPSGPTGATLDRLARLVLACSAERLVVLGDLLHARAAQSDAVMTPFRAWRRAHAALTVTLVRGNHDGHAGDPPADLAIEAVDAPHALGPFALCHDHTDGLRHEDADVAPAQRRLSQPLDSPGYRLEGHLHPAVRLSARVGRSLRLPCFCIGPTRTLLPAFGDFTGTALIRPASDESILAIAHGQLLALPPATASRQHPARRAIGRTAPTEPEC